MFKWILKPVLLIAGLCLIGLVVSNTMDLNLIQYCTSRVLPALKLMFVK